MVVDFHAEVTSEKVAMGWHLDGRVAACLGTHTHVPTADARVLPGGTAFISDVGMTGSRAGVIGVRREQALEAFRTQMPVKFDTADEDVWINAVVVEVRDDGLARVDRAGADARRPDKRGGKSVAAGASPPVGRLVVCIRAGTGASNTSCQSCWNPRPPAD